jgi:hypothetical protein
MQLLDTPLEFVLDISDLTPPEEKRLNIGPESREWQELRKDIRRGLISINMTELEITARNSRADLVACQKRMALAQCRLRNGR